MMAAMATTWNKPADVSVFPRRDDPDAPSVMVSILEAQPWRIEIPWPEGFEAGIVHRLDNATSGALVVADSLEELEQLRTLFTEHVLTKRYVLLAAKDVVWNVNVCDRALAHHPSRSSRMVVQRGNETAHRGKWYPASTSFERIRGLVFEATMATGVMHQIRAHAAFVGIPIAGDRLYGGAAAEAARPEGGPTFCLHHVGLSGPGGFTTDEVPMPGWATVPGKW
jgi:23S rRNA-/tRNA-specific pseudouridylate synthase